MSLARNLYMLAVTVLCLAFVSLFFPHAAESAQEIVIKGSYVNLRETPDTSGKIVGKAVQGEVLPLVSQKGDWYEVRKDGNRCWLAGWLVDVRTAASTAASASTAEITGSVVNVRSGPGTTYSIVGKAEQGKKYQVAEKSGQWYKVKYGSGYGWIISDYLKITTAQAGSGTAAPVSGGGTAIASVSTAEIIGSVVNVRSGPGTTYSIVGKAEQGKKYQVAEKSGKWYKVKYGSGYGWIISDYLKITTAQTGSGTAAPVSSGGTAIAGVSTAEVTGSAVNVRSGPGTTFSIVGNALQGSKHEVAEKSGQWYKVKYGSGYGWIISDYLKITTAQAGSGTTGSGTSTSNSGLVTPPVASTGGSGSQTSTTSGNAQPSSTSSTAAGDAVAEITNAQVDIRDGPGSGYALVKKAARGEVYEVLSRSGSWYEIKLDSKTGWVAAEGIKTKVIGDAKAVATGVTVNIRSGPGMEYGTVSRANPGEGLLLLDQSAQWYKVKLANGKTGWVVAWLVEQEKEKPEDPGEGTDVAPPTPGLYGLTNVGGATIPSAGSGEIASVVAGEDGEGTVVIIKSGGNPLYPKTTVLSGPNRLVIDFQGLEPGMFPESVSVNTSLVSNIRVGKFSSSPPVARIVLDLKNVAWYRIKSPDGGTECRIEVFMARSSVSLMDAVIAIDAGHGGSEVGATGPTGLQEKVVNLDIATKVEQYLKQMNVQVVMTRTDDRTVDLYERPRIANRAGATIFVSIHANANPKPQSSGISTYHVRTVDAGMEDAAAQSSYLARSIQDKLLAGLGRNDMGVLKADFVVLTGSDMPAVLVEVCFISNREEEALLKDEAFRDRAARAIVEGIKNYFG